MKKKFAMGCGIFVAIIIIILIILVSTVIGKYNTLVKLDETVKEKWGQVENVYQRRYDLIPNLVETVKGYAKHEKDTFIKVTEARSKVGGMLKVSDKVLQDPAMFNKFQQAQGELSSALQRLMVVVEKHPDLKANQNFLALQDQLEGTENRIAVERRRFNEAAREYNIFRKRFPNIIIANMFGFNERPYFKSMEQAKTAPKVKF